MSEEGRRERVREAERERERERGADVLISLKKRVTSAFLSKF